ncbi:hypothetical protein Edno5_0012 [Edwardsiella phage Edno5]|uniref:Uncharacterized protein n=1 Tax=Edwardsiella phage Edno5 TaxID=2419942 RepID=A0A3G3BYA2_9CAUD|nr:head protein [Edwardsiella phage Edno5]AYP69218.1 hypothetical protein Edno5_0012 [Edwardsiella phage Edno5]RFT04029.1 hypothetical protein CGL57_09920 [Edwardsiella anguillarum]
MNIRSLANRAIQRVNPNITAVLKKYAGETIGPGCKPIPSYLPDQNVTIQLQPLSKGDLQHVDGLNIQGLVKSIHVYGNYFSVQRELEQGGDLFIIDGHTWLVVEPIELWDSWCRLIVNLQVSP